MENIFIMLVGIFGMMVSLILGWYLFKTEELAKYIMPIFGKRIKSNKNSFNSTKVNYNSKALDNTLKSSTGDETELINVNKENKSNGVEEKLQDETRVL